MNAINIDSTYKQNEPYSRAPHIAKIILVAAVIAALAVATFFSAGAASSLIAAGAASWKIGFIMVGCIASATSLLGSVYFSLKNNMYEDTGHNSEDAANFILGTLGSGFFVAAEGIKMIQQWEIWNLILS